MKITDLKINNSNIKLGIDTAYPVFSWLNKSKETGKEQSAYRIIVSSSPEKAEKCTGDIWDSQKTTGENNYDISYKGEKLKSKTQYYWRVMIWDEKDSPSPWSETAGFETGIMTQDQWQAKWIGKPGMKIQDRYSVLLRKEFAVKNKVKSARAYICGLGLYDLKINGKNPDDTLLNPAHTQYEKTVLYNVFDVTGLLSGGIESNNSCGDRGSGGHSISGSHSISGGNDGGISAANAIGVELGHGFYNETFQVWNWQTAVWRDNPKVIMELTINYEDGTSETIITDESWQTAEGPIAENSIYFGETYDARNEKCGFDMPGYNSSPPQWQNAVIVNKPEGKLIFQNMEPIRKTDTFEPKIEKLGSGAYLITNPVMTAGWMKITAKAKRGEVMDIAYGERLGPDGQLNKIVAWGGALQRDRYIFKSSESETFEPKFSYKGYKYIQIDGSSEDIEIEKVICCGIHNDVEHISKFECGNELINTLHDIEKRTILNNFHGKPSDTPVYEKNGWTGDVNFTAETICYNFDVRSFMSQYMNDLRDAQLENGIVPVIVPTAGWGLDDHPVWNTVYIFVMQHLYNFYGMDNFSNGHYESMKRLLAKVLEDMDQSQWVWTLERLGDWVAPAGGNLKRDRDNPPEGGGITSTAFIYKALEIMSEIALRRGKTEDSVYYKDMARKIYVKFNEAFYKPEKGMYFSNKWNYESDRTKYRQTDQLVAAAFGLVPEKHLKVVIENLAADIKKKNYHLDTGSVGTKLILPVLSDHGYKALAYEILAQTTYPSWGFWVKEYGATSTWESYEITGRSHNHFFLGTYDEWLFKGLAGIRDIKDGYKNFVIKPQIIDKLAGRPEREKYPVDKLRYVKASVKTPRGLLESNWNIKEDGSAEVSVTVPFGSAAEVYIPASLSSDDYLKNIVKSGSYKWEIDVEK